MIRPTTKAQLRSNPTFGSHVRIVDNTIVDSGTRAELKERNIPGSVNFSRVDQRFGSATLNLLAGLAEHLGVK